MSATTMLIISPPLAMNRKRLTACTLLCCNVQ